MFLTCVCVSVRDAVLHFSAVTIPSPFIFKVVWVCFSLLLGHAWSCECNDQFLLHVFEQEM